MSLTAKPQTAIKGSKAWKKGTPEEQVKTEADEVRRWLSHIKSAGKEAEDWRSECKDAWREYQAESRKDAKYRAPVDWTANTYSRYWSDTMVLLPAIYGECPKAIARMRFDNDDIARTACKLLERLAAYLMAQSNFHKAMQHCALEYLHCSRSTGRAFFEASFTKRNKRVSLQEIEVPDEQALEEPMPGEEMTGEAPPPEPQMITVLVDENNDAPPEDAVILTDENGLPYYELEDEKEDVEDPRFWLRPLHFDEIVHSTGARAFEDIWWMAFKCTATRKQAVERFGDVITKILDTPSDEDTSKKSKPDLFQYWELWDKREKKVCWLHELHPESYLDSEDDAYGLIDFFPCPRFMTVNERYNDLYPVPDFTQTRDQYEQLHLLQRRINRVTKSIKGSLIYDSSVEGLTQLFQADDNEGIAISNFRDLLNKGGLDQLIQIPAYERLATTLQTLIQVFQKTSEDLDQLRGISDIIRGTSDPAVSATAERIKKAAANNRFSQRQKEMNRFVRDSLEVLCDLALKVLEDDQIREIVGYPYLDLDDQERFEEALVMMRDDKQRLVRVDIETDSLLALDEQEEKQNAIEILDSFSKFGPALFQTAQQNPAIAAVGFKLLQLNMSKFRYGKDGEDALKDSINQVMQTLQNPPQPPPEPPDAKLIKIQSEERIAQMEMQLKAQMEAAENQIKQMELQVEAMMNQATVQLAQRKQLWQEQIDAQKLNLSAQETQLIVSERMAEEQRLNREQELDVARLNQELSQPLQQPQVQQPPVVINVQGGQPGQPVPIPIPQEPQLIPVNPLTGVPL